MTSAIIELLEQAAALAWQHAELTRVPEARRQRKLDAMRIERVATHARVRVLCRRPTHAPPALAAAASPPPA